MAGQEKWYFTREQLVNSPSRKCGLDADKELAYRQQAANLIQDMGQRLQVSQLCINTAIVYMHRFYAFHSFTQFHRNTIAAAALFLAAKVEEQPRKLEYVIKVSHMCLHRGESVAALDTRSEHYQEQPVAPGLSAQVMLLDCRSADTELDMAQDLVFNENVLLQTLGFDVAIDHPHTHVVRTCHLVKAPKDLAQTSYFMASNSLHLTTMCLQYRPTVVACFCIHLASKWSNWAIPQSNEGKHWFFYVDRTVTAELLERLTAEFLHIFDKCPSRLKKRMMNMSNASTSSPQAGLPQAGGSSAQAGGAQVHDKKQAAAHARSEQAAAAAAAAAAVDEFDKSFDREYERERRRPQAAGGYVPATSAAPALSAPVPPASSTVTPAKIDYNAYRDKREREERDRRQMSQRSSAPAQRPASTAPPAIAPSSQPGPASTTAAPSHHQRPQPHHHKPHHSWPHHKPPHHKPPHDHRHHRPSQSVPPNQVTLVPPTSGPPQSVQQDLPSAPPPQRTRPPSLFSPENATTPTAAAAAAPRRTQEVPRPPPQRRPPPTHQPQPPLHSHSGHPVHSSHTSHGVTHTDPVATHRPPASPSHQRKRPPDAGASATATAVVREMQPKLSPMLSPFSSPPPKETAASSAPAIVAAAHRQHRPRQPAPTLTEPELVPVVKKLDETPGYENVVRDSQRAAAAAARAARRLDASSTGIHVPTSTPMAGPPPRALNGIETDPTLVSNLLKESLAKPTPITVPTERKSPAPLTYAMSVPPATVHPSEREVKREPQSEYKPTLAVPPLVPSAASTAAVLPIVAVESVVTAAAPATDDIAEHKHKKEKKKKDKHKHKDRDKSKEERKKHKKDKDRERRQETAPPPPPPPRPPTDIPPVPLDVTPAHAVVPPAPGALRITIPREKLAASPGLKIKIPKERLAAPPPPPHHQQGAHLPPAAGPPSSHHHHGQSSGIKIKISKDVLETSRKRGGPPDAGPPHKIPRHNGAPPPHKVEPHAPPLRNGHAM